MLTLRGLVYVRHGRVGTRSEGPDYMLQTDHGDLALRYTERYLWQPDYKLEFYARRMVEVHGEMLGDSAVQVTDIQEILSPAIPSSRQPLEIPVDH